MSDSPERDHATLRRAPKLSMFLLMGGSFGAIVTFILTAIFPVDEQVGFGPLVGYFMLYGIPAGVVLGAVIGLILDRRSRRHATEVSVEHETIVESESESESESGPEPEPEPESEPEPASEPVEPEALELDAERLEPLQGEPTSPER